MFVCLFVLTTPGQQEEEAGLGPANPAKPVAEKPQATFGSPGAIVREALKADVN